MKRLKTTKRSGQALTEFAFMLPLILVLLLGAIEFGRYAYVSILIGNAAHAAAVYATQNNGVSSCPGAPSTGCGPCSTTCPIVIAATNDFQNNGQPGSALSIAVTNTCGCDSGGTFTAASSCFDPPNTSAGTCPSGANWVIMVNVTASGTFNALFGYPGIPSSLTISRTATMRVA